MDLFQEGNPVSFTSCLINHELVEATHGFGAVPKPEDEVNENK